MNTDTDRLRLFLEENFSGKNLVVVSNREPYSDKKVEHQELVAYYRMADVGKGPRMRMPSKP